jgi:glucuronate isomerase
MSDFIHDDFLLTTEPARRLYHAHAAGLPFIGMTTDSRSLLSMVRHEYFRRVLCDWLGHQVAAGMLPHDDQLLGRLVRDLCYDNARRWLFRKQTTLH